MPPRITDELHEPPQTTDPGEGGGQVRCILPLPPIPHHGADCLYPRTRVVADLWPRGRARSGWWCACVRACVSGCGCCGGGGG
eukprot:6189885-Pyramimonas_sp.AAC.1